MSVLTTGLDDLGQPRRKRPSYGYIVYSGAEPMLLRLGETTTGSERTWPYAMEPRQNPPTMLTKGRYRPGQGILATYFRVSLANTNGAAFEVSEFKLTALDAAREV